MHIEDRICNIAKLRFSADSSSFSLCLPCLGARDNAQLRLVTADILAIMPPDWEHITDANDKRGVVRFQRKQVIVKYKK